MSKREFITVLLVTIVCASMSCLVAFKTVVSVQGKENIEPLVSSFNNRSESWSMFHNYLNHSGACIDQGPNIGQSMWNFTTGGPVVSSPAVSGGFVYVGSEDDYVYCLKAAGAQTALNQCGATKRLAKWTLLLPYLVVMFTLDRGMATSTA